MIEAGRNAGRISRVDFSTTLKIFHVYHIINENSPCSLIFYTTECSWSLIPLTTCIIGFIWIQAALTIERVIATYRLGHYEREGKYVGPTLAIMVLLLSILCMRWGLAATDDAEVLAQCASIPSSATPRMNVVYFIMLIVDLISMLVFAYCLYHNKRKLNSGKYSLDLRYEIQENVKVLRILFPIVISHLFVFGLFIIGRSH
ncbi:unnamed protein product [Cylicocyclus nassatus]|uniref:Uncharacterized protein n=1 Tax=Cylicocyclus nassatus TaxID=53992 RepID=A0AA36HD15_CYLNA|nr:unnamed protein product [Cylicocyclus nassatus]